ncbi:Transmembrane protein 184C [Talaromyces islandicus]|uniref:Transmembrane protein 184C n=1 Tax=Talaromyces islandicus TaxID=28573 RepID=A0A0U1LX14_TALIS|nr:Transmembrane protein 184C [Talaromyces islandicus]
MMLVPLERRMSWTTCNTTLEDDSISEVALWHNGLTFHRLGLILCAAFGLVAICCSVFLMFAHATHYSKPREQRHIIRILFMVPIYSVASFLCFLYYRKSVYFEVLCECYEAFAISAFFTLLCHYIAPDLHTQKDYFRTIRPQPWLWPLNWFAKCCGGERGCWRTPRSGLTWFNIIWICIFQYCVIRVSMTIVAVVTEAFGRYCEASLSPAYSHVWTLVIESIAVSIAMYCLIQFYVQIRLDVAQYSPFLKILSIKLVIFLSFWQTTVISFLTSSGAMSPSEKVGYQDIKIGIPNLLICLEMSIFAVLHFWAFPFQPYRLKNQQTSEDPQYVNGKVDYHGGPMGIKAFMDAFNPWDLVKAVGRGFRWLFVGVKTRTQDPSYMNQEGTSFSLKNSDVPSPHTSTPGPTSTAYMGASGEEGEELLSHAQANPTSYHHPAPSETEIGVVHSYHDEESQNRYYSQRYDDSPPPAAHALASAEPRPISPQAYNPYNAYNPHNAYNAYNPQQHSP